MSLEMAHKVIVPPKKNYIPQFLKQRDIIVNKPGLALLHYLADELNHGCRTLWRLSTRAAFSSMCWRYLGSSLPRLHTIGRHRDLLAICLHRVLTKWIPVHCTIFLYIRIQYKKYGILHISCILRYSITVFFVNWVADPHHLNADRIQLFILMLIRSCFQQ